MKTSVKSQKLIDTGYKLFSQYGFKATGVDFIIKESNISKATLYKYFTTKNLLILAVLKQRHAENIEAITEAMENEITRTEPVLGLFDLYHQRFQHSKFFGCLFIRAATEFNEKDCEINAFASQVKEDLRQLLIKYLIKDTRDKEQSEYKANCLMLLIEGSIINAQVCKNKNAALDAKRIASFLLKDEAEITL